MRFYFLLLFFIQLLSANPYDKLYHDRLKNSMEVYLLPDEKAKNVQIKVAVKVGMKAEDKAHAGISHLVEHMVFRDGRIKYRDYYDLIKEKGATYVNGYTSYYQTQYVTTINPDNAYWIADTFAKMLFDKNVSDKDLEVEKGALQIEIGEPNWTDIFSKLKIGKALDHMGDLFPPLYDLYEDDFYIDTKVDERDYFDASTYKENNQKFTLDAVMKHYHDYYFPSNMTLKIVGKFDLEKMKEHVEKSFGRIKNHPGKTLERPIYKDATLSGEPYISYENAGLFNVGHIELGTKMLTDDPQKVAVVKSYMENLADRLNREFRNKKGETYSTFGGLNSYHNAALASIEFETPHKVFDKNLKIAKAWLEKETSGDINDSIIHDAIKQKLKYYESTEHDTDSLLDVVYRYENYRKFYGEDVKKLPYDYIKEITPDAYRAILKEAFVTQNSYQEIQRDYVWFPYEGSILAALLFFLFLYFFVRFFHSKVKKRQVKFYRRISSIWTIMIVSMVAMFLASLLYEWLAYGVTEAMGIHSLYGDFDIPLAYLIMIVDFLFSLLVLYLVVKKLFSWFYHSLILTDKDLILAGPTNKKIALSDISSCEVVPWSPSLLAKVYGMAIFFWRPLLKITCKSGEVLYIRHFRAKELKEDLAHFVTC